MPDLVACVLLALTSTSLDNLGLGVQKAGSEWMAGGPRALLKDPRNLVRFGVWVSGILMCIAAPVTLAMALDRGPASVVSALGAFGLVPLYLFAGLVLKENVTKPHYLALVAIMAGVAVVGVGTTRGDAALERLDVRGLALSAGLLVLLPAALSGVAAWARSRHLALALGILSGALGGLNLLVLKVGAVLDSWWTTGGGWIAVATLAFLVLQVAYRHGTAVQIVPSNTATALLVPVAAAPFAFGEPITAHLVIGLGAILAGIGALAWGEQVAAEQARAAVAVG